VSFAVLLIAPTVLLARHADDAHWNGDSAAPLYHLSVFAHGFIHGYEDGFRIADAVYQLGMPAASVDSYPQYKDATSRYDSSFGPKDHFKAGYREGFRAGYEDSIHNRRFRAVEAARDSAAGLTLSPGNAFDIGFEGGYRAAAAADAEDASVPCDAQTANNQRMIKAGYCEGFNRGVRFWQEGASPPSTDGATQGVVTAARR
jgi:hypothetical protein